MPWGTVWRSAPGPGPLPAAADANLSAEAAGAAELGSGGSGAFAASLKANCASDRKAGSRLGRARPSEALPREAQRRAGCRPTRDRRARIPGAAHPCAGSRCERGTKARERESQRGVEPGGFPSVPRRLPLPPTYFRGGEERRAGPGSAPAPRVSLRSPVPLLNTSEAPTLCLAVREPSPSDFSRDPGGRSGLLERGGAAWASAAGVLVLVRLV